MESVQALYCETFLLHGTVAVLPGAELVAAGEDRLLHLPGQHRPQSSI